MVQPDMEVVEPRITITATCPMCNKGVAYLIKTYIIYNGMWARMEHHLYCPECQKRQFIITNQHRQYVEAVRHIYRQGAESKEHSEKTKEAEDVQIALSV